MFPYIIPIISQVDPFTALGVRDGIDYGYEDGKNVISVENVAGLDYGDRESGSFVKQPLGIKSGQDYEYGSGTPVIGLRTYPGLDYGDRESGSVVKSFLATIDGIDSRYESCEAELPNAIFYRVGNAVDNDSTESGEVIKSSYIPIFGFKAKYDIGIGVDTISYNPPPVPVIEDGTSYGYEIGVEVEAVVPYVPVIEDGADYGYEIGVEVEAVVPYVPVIEDGTSYGYEIGVEVEAVVPYVPVIEDGTSYGYEIGVEAVKALPIIIEDGADYGYELGIEVVKLLPPSPLENGIDSKYETGVRVNGVLYGIPPLADELLSIELNPNDTSTTNINIQAIGNFGAIAGIGAGYSEAKPTIVKSYKIIPNIIVNPPFEDANPSTGYRLVCAFWAQDKLNILVYSSSSTSTYFRRLIHYQASIQWDWERVDAGNLKSYHGNTSLGSLTSYRVLRTSDGVSVFVSLDNSYPFGDIAPSSPTLTGVLRYELKDNGDINSYFETFASLPSYLSSPTIRFLNPDTDEIILNANTNLAANVISDEGTRWGLSTYAMRAGTDGFPFPTIINTPQVNDWYWNHDFNQAWASAFKPSATQPVIKQGSNNYLRFKTSTSQNITGTFAFNADGHALYRYRANNVCESDFSCSAPKNLQALAVNRMGSTQFETIIIDEQNNTTGTPAQRIQNKSFSDPFWNFDRHGNVIELTGTNLHFYSASGSYYLDLTDLQGISASNSVSLINTITPWGFCYIRRSSISQNLLSNNHEIYFIQSN